MNRPTPETVRQFASQTRYLSVSDRQTIARILPLEETPDYLLGLLVGLRIACEATDQQRRVLGKVVAILAERVVNTPGGMPNEINVTAAREIRAEIAK